MGFDGFPKQTLTFLRGVTKNNDKKWFETHRGDYEANYLDPARLFVDAMAAPLRKIAPEVQALPKVNGSIRRINRDTRFSKDKTPYKNHLDLWFWEGPVKGSGKGCPGFYIRVTPNQVGIGVGMHAFDDQQLKRYRKSVADDETGKALERAIAKAQKAGGYALSDPDLKRVPRGFEPDHTRAHLLRHKGLYLFHEVKPPKELHSQAFVTWCTKHFKAMSPLNGWLAEL